MIDPEILRVLPKLELHCHLEGSLRAETLIELARRRGVDLPTADPDALYRFDDLTAFLAVYELACLAMVTRDDFARVTYEALEDAVLSSNVRYREMFFNPSLHPGVDYPVMLAGILDGARAAELDHGVRTRLIPSIYRQLPVAEARELVEVVVAHRVDQVIGIGMDGDELADPPEKFIGVYRQIAEAGLARTAHVAHDGPASMIRTVLDDLGCSRIDHGYHVIDDPDLLAEMVRQRVPFMCATPTPPICGWSDDIDESPIRTMIEAGLTVVLNSDDPTMLGTDLATEFDKVCNGWELPPERVRRFITDSIDAAWMDDVDKRAARYELLPEIDRMLGLEELAASR